MSSCTTAVIFSAFPATDDISCLPWLGRFSSAGCLLVLSQGLLSFGFLKIYGEPQVDRAVVFETQQDEAKAAAEKAESHNHMPVSHDHASEAHTHIADHDEPALVSRSVQAGLGLFVAVLVYSAAFGGLFGLAFAFAYGRTSGTLTPQAHSNKVAESTLHCLFNRMARQESEKSPSRVALAGA
jgi:hypothetical protein